MGMTALPKINLSAVLLGTSKLICLDALRVYGGLLNGSLLALRLVPLTPQTYFEYTGVLVVGVVGTGVVSYGAENIFQKHYGMMRTVATDI